MNQTFPMPLGICNLKLISTFLQDLDGITVYTCVTALCKTVVINPQASFVCESLAPHELCCLDSTAFAMLLHRSLTYNGHILFKTSHICLSFSRPWDTLQQVHTKFKCSTQQRAKRDNPHHSRLLRCHGFLSDCTEPITGKQSLHSRGKILNCHYQTLLPQNMTLST